jgi:flagellar basal-body rod protein FlgG
MISALKIAATGMQAQQMNVDVLSNNIANMNTTGFKRQRAAFEDLVYQNRIAPGATTSSAGTVAPTGAQVGLGVNVGAVYSIFTQGTVSETGNALDMAIQGRGFFKITMPDGTTGYSRDGSFQIDANGQVVTSDGYLLDPNFTVPPETLNLTISETGYVTAKINDVITDLGQITLAMFTNEAGLESIGGNIYKETVASGTATDVNPTKSGAGSILQSFLEYSNVDPIEAVTSLITAQRAYELNSKVITTADEMLAATNQMR